MTKNKKSSDKSKMVAGRADIKRLWRIISPSDWLALFQEIAPSNRWEMSGQGSIKACCPYHDDNTPSFHLSFNKRMGKCYGDVCEKLVVDLVALVAKLRNCSYTEALLFLNDRFTLGDKLATSTDELNKYNNNQELKKEVAMAANQVLIELSRDNTAHLEYCRPALVYLTDVRKLPITTLHALPVGVYAKPLHLKKYMPDTLHALFDEYFAKYQSPAYWGALLFHYNDSPGSISRFKLRMRNLDVPEGPPTKAGVEGLDPTVKAQMYKREYAYIEDPYAERFGLYGLHKYHRMIGQNDADAYLTEGEFDVLAVMAAQDDQSNSEFMILGTGGKGATSVGFLREYGIRSCWMVPDHPAKKGEVWAQAILGDRSNFLVDGDYTRPIDFKVFQWPVSVTGMDLDEAVRKSGYAHMVDVLFRQRTVNFKNAFRWVKSQCDAEVDKLKRTYNSRIEALDPQAENVANQRESLVDEKRRRMFETLGKWFRYLYDQSDRLAFTQEYEASEGVDLSQIAQGNQAANGMDTLEGTVQKVVIELQGILSVPYYEIKSTEPVYYAYSKIHHRTFPLYSAERPMKQGLPLLLGSDHLSWLEKLLGENPILLEGTEGSAPLKAATIKERNATLIMERALRTFCNQVPHKTELKPVGQGIHYVDLPPWVSKERTIFFVNGDLVLKGHYEDDNTLQWQLVDSSVDSRLIFSDMGASEKWSCVDGVEDLEAAVQIDHADTFDKLDSILKGWKFQHDEVIRPYLAAYIMALPVMTAIGNVNITYVTGERESGKTSLICHLLGGNEGGGNGICRPILETAKSISDITPAAINQNFTDKTLTMVVDEAEVSKNHDTKHDRTISELIRRVHGLPMGPLPVHRGGVTADQKVKYTLKMPVLMAGINMPTDPVFLSRIMFIQTVKDPGRKEPMVHILDAFAEEALEDLRKAITIGLLPHIPEIVAIRERIMQPLLEAGSGIAKSSTRFLNTVLTPLAVYEFLGHDSSELYCQILNRYKNMLESIHGQSDYNSLLNACLYLEAIKVPNEDSYPDLVSAKSLIQSGQYNLLNNCVSGVYYLPEFDWIVVVWRQVKHSILNKTEYVRMEENDLKGMASRNPYVVEPVSPEQDDQIKYLLVLSDVRGPADYTVITAEYLIKNQNLKADDDPDTKLDGYVECPFTM